MMSSLVAAVAGHGAGDGDVADGAEADGSCLDRLVGPLPTPFP
ncbi:MAG: hypothetical protein ACKV19_07375 [Verrucomicrobiales bacterium]